MLEPTFEGQPHRMDPRIRFETKEQSNARRREAFLALSPAERFAWFLRSFDRRTPMSRSEGSGRFLIRRTRDPLR